MFFFFHSSWDSLAFGMWSDFQLKPGYFGHYLVNLWILHEPPVLADFLWRCCSRGKEWQHLITARLEEKSSFPHLASVDIQGREGLLGTSGQRWEVPFVTRPLRIPLQLEGSGVSHYCFMHGLHWHQGSGSVVASLLLGSGQNPDVSSLGLFWYHPSGEREGNSITARWEMKVYVCTWSPLTLYMEGAREDLDLLLSDRMKIPPPYSSF